MAGEAVAVRRGARTRGGGDPIPGISAARTIDLPLHRLGLTQPMKQCWSVVRNAGMLRSLSLEFLDAAVLVLASSIKADALHLRPRVSALEWHFDCGAAYYPRFGPFLEGARRVNQRRLI